MAEELSENAKRQLEADREASQKSREQFQARMKGKPTPTQDECDRAALGEHIAEHEADGSDPDPGVTRALEGGRGGTYQTRQSTAARPASAPPHRPPSSS